MIPTEAYPLHWPAGRPQSKWRESARFKTTLGKAIQNLIREVDLLGGVNLILSSNLPLRKDGLPFSRPGYIGNPGVAAYFMLKKKPMCFACDRWDDVQDNMQAVAKTIEALRGIERWGSGGMVEQAFTGFVALPAPTAWWQTLGLYGPNASKPEIEQAHRRLSMQHHPDRDGGSHDKMADINRARDLGLDATRA